MKNRIFKIFIAVLLIAVMALPLFSCGSKTETASGTWGEFKWDLSNGTLYVHGSGKLPNAASPKEVGWASVRDSVVRVVFDGKITAFGNYAFYGMSSLTAIPESEGVTYIGKGAFSFCTSLTDVKIPDTVTAIGESAFEGCTKIEKVTIPASVTSIGDRAFMYCRSLKSFVSTSEALTSIGKWTFNDCRALSTVILNDATAINASAFEKAKIGADKVERTNVTDGKVTVTVECRDEKGEIITIKEEKTDAEGKTFYEDRKYVKEQVVELGEVCKFEAEKIAGYTLTGEGTISFTALKNQTVIFNYKKDGAVDAPATNTPSTDTPSSETPEAQTPSTENTATAAPAETSKPAETAASSKPEEKKSTATTVIALVIFGVVIVGICVGAFLLVRSDKKQKKNGTTVRKNVDNNGKNKKNGKRK